MDFFRFETKTIDDFYEEISKEESEIKTTQQRIDNYDKEIERLKNETEENKLKSDYSEYGSYEETIKYYNERRSEDIRLINSCNSHIERHRTAIIRYNGYKNYIDELVSALENGLDNYDFDDLMHYYNTIKGDFATELQGEYIDLQKELIRYKEEKLPSEKIEMIKNYIDGKQEKNYNTEQIRKISLNIVDDIKKITEKKLTTSGEEYVATDEDIISSWNRIVENMDKLPDNYKKEIQKLEKYIEAKEIASNVIKNNEQQENPENDLIDKYKQERENIIAEIDKLKKEFNNPSENLNRQIEILDQLKELRTDLEKHNEIIHAYNRIIANNSKLGEIAKQRVFGNSQDLDLEEQKILAEIESDKAKLPIELLNSLNNNRQSDAREGHTPPKPKKVTKTKIKEFAKNHKKLLITLGITALAASTIICFMPALMTLNSGLWATVGQSEVLHGANMVMGKILQVLPFMGSHNFTAAGFHTFATIFGTTTVGQLVLPTAVAGIVQAVGLGKIYNKLKSASLTFTDKRNDLRKIEKTIAKKEYDHEDIKTKLYNIEYEMDIKFNEGKLSEKEYDKLHDMIANIYNNMDKHKEENRNNDDELNDNKESKDSKTVSVNTEFRFNPNAKRELFNWEDDEELTTGRGR